MRTRSRSPSPTGVLRTSSSPSCAGEPTWSVNSSGAAPVPLSAPSMPMKSACRPISSMALQSANHSRETAAWLPVCADSDGVSRPAPSCSGRAHAGWPRARPALAATGRLPSAARAERRRAQCLAGTAGFAPGCAWVRLRSPFSSSTAVERESPARVAASACRIRWTVRRRASCSPSWRASSRRSGVIRGSVFVALRT